MKTNNLKIIIYLSAIILLGPPAIKGQSKQKKEEPPSEIKTNINSNGIEFNFEFTKGKYNSHPTMAIWLEDLDGNFIQTLFVTQSFASGIFHYGKVKYGQWAAGPKKKPAALPYWLHKSGKFAQLQKQPMEKTDANTGATKRKDNNIPQPEIKVDAYSGATPSGSFTLNAKSDEKRSTKFRLMVEVNQAFDFNEYWTNTKYPDDEEYKTSGQPAVIYSVTIDPNDKADDYYLNAMGHSHYSGLDGKLYTDLTTISTALDIFKKIKVTLKN